MVAIRKMQAGEERECERILRSLPEWFGIESALVEYVQSLSRLETWVAEVSDGPASGRRVGGRGSIVGFLALYEHNRVSAEIHVMAVDPEHHRGGIGRRLVETAEEHLRARSFQLFQVKTLGPSRPSEHYARTRGFYERLGFLPLEENRLWGETNPCLILVKSLAGPASIQPDRANSQSG